MPAGRPAIGDYAIIGDCRSAALVSRDGSIDWLYWPRFDSPSLFAAILDQEVGGRFAVRPVRPASSTRRYLGETNVLETTFVTDAGVLRLTDLMPVDSEAGKRGKLWAAHQILRRVKCLAGEVEVEVLCEPRPDYGREACRLEDRGPLGLYFEKQGRAEIEARGFNQRLGSYVSTYGGDQVDASLLLLARYGYLDPRSERARGTRDAVLRRLGANGLLYRYRGSDDGLPGDDGAFGIRSFWAVDAYALASEVEAGEALFERVLDYANDLGLFAEEIDPADGAALGNFPQAFIHVGLIDAALVLQSARARSGPRSDPEVVGA